MSTRIHLSFSLLGLLLASCATGADEKAKAMRPTRLAPDFNEPVSAEAEAASSPIPSEDDESWRAAIETFQRNMRVESSAEPVLLRIDESDSTFWRDASFRRRFNESYIAETDIEPAINLIERDLIQQVYDLMSNERQPEALALLETNRGPAASAALDMFVGNLHFGQEKFEEAAAAYEVAVTKHPKFRRAWSALGQTYFRVKNMAGAIRALTRAIETGASNSLNFGLLGFCYLASENSLSAESAYRMAILLDPQTDDWKTGLVRCFAKQRRHADVVAMCGEMLAVNPERAELWEMQARAYFMLNEPMRAAENYEMLDRMGKLSASNLINLGDIYVSQELFDIAVSTYLRGLEKDPALSPDRAIRAARVVFNRGARDESRTLVAGIEKARPELETEQRKEVLRLRARMSVADGATDEQARALEEIVTLDPLDGEALILLGQHAARGGDLDKAVLFYERAAGIEAFEADAKKSHGQLLVGQGRHSEALLLLRRAQSLKPSESLAKYVEAIERLSQGKAQ